MTILKLIPLLFLDPITVARSYYCPILLLLHIFRKSTEYLWSKHRRKRSRNKWRHRLCKQIHM